MEKHTFTAIVEIFPQEGGWYYVPVPPEYSEIYAERANRGLIAISATIGKFTWNTSFLPKGDGTHFIPLPQKVRKSEDITLRDTIEVIFSTR